MLVFVGGDDVPPRIGRNALGLRPMDFSACALWADPFGRAIWCPNSARSAAQAKPVAELREHPGGPVTRLAKCVAPVGQPGRLEAERARDEHAHGPERECCEDHAERNQHGDIVGGPAPTGSVTENSIEMKVALVWSANSSASGLRVWGVPMAVAPRRSRGGRED